MSLTKILIHDVNGLKYLVPVEGLIVLGGCPGGHGAVEVGGKMIITKERPEQLHEMVGQCCRIVRMDADALHPNVTIFDPATYEQKLLNWGAEIVNAVHHCKRSDMLLPPCGPVIIKVDGKAKLRSDLSMETIAWLSEILDSLPTADIPRMVEIHKKHQELMMEGGEL